MWISRNEYENLNENIKCLGGYYTHKINLLKDKIKSLEFYEQEAKEYKQKYVDEVQKRLELVKLLENTP